VPRYLTCPYSRSTIDKLIKIAGIKELFVRSGHPVPEEERKVFLDSFAKDISPKEIKRFVTETDRILLRQTIAEYQVLDLLRDNRQLIVKGGPGSGKTWLALEQAFRYAEEGLQVLLLCYNVALAEQLSALVAKRNFETGKGGLTGVTLS
jgi:superfamily II DNA or RNA helicase